MAKVLTLPTIPREQAQYDKACALMTDGDLDAAYDVIDKVLRADPNDAQALSIASEVLKKAKKLPVAYALAKRAADLRPDRPETWSTFGHAAQQLWRIDEAIDAYRKALARTQNPKQRCLYLNNLGSCYIDAGQFVAAEDYCRQSLAIDATHVNARHNLGLSLLAQHKWAEGWQNYSASIGTGVRLNTKYMDPPEPTWDGTPGQTVVVYGEQGLGDEICAASMLPDVIRDSKRVIVDCDKRLVGLFSRSFPQARVYGTRLEKQLRWDDADRKIDASVAAFEVAKFYRNSDESFPGAPYLKPCPIRTAGWREHFAAQNKLAIGIAWSGGIWHNAGAFRQLPLADWKPIFDAVDAQWVSLQYKDAAAYIAGTPVVQYPFATLSQDYDDTAALVAALDLVICVQTTVGHLGGALGVPTWVMVPRTSQWRYGEVGDSLPWYRSVKVYRQTQQWPVHRIAEDLRARFANH